MNNNKCPLKQCIDEHAYLINNPYASDEDKFRCFKKLSELAKKHFSTDIKSSNSSIILPITNNTYGISRSYNASSFHTFGLSNVSTHNYSEY